MRRVLCLMFLAVSFAAPAFAQQSAPRAATPTPTPPKVDGRIDISDVNIGLTVNIADKNTGGTQTKTVSLVIANQQSGRVRSSGNTVAGGNNRGSELNVDALCTLMKSGAIRAQLTVNYVPEWTDEVTKMTGVLQSVTLYLKDGQPTLITQAADPTKGTRSVSIEVTAKVIR